MFVKDLKNNSMKKKQLIIFLWIAMAGTIPAIAQNERSSFEDFRKNIKENFQGFRKKVFEDYDKYFAMPDLVGKTLAEAKANLKELEISFECEDLGGIITKQIPEAGSMINKYTVAYITTGG